MDEAQPEAKISMLRWFGLLAIAVGVALIVVDTTIVNVIIPLIIEELNTGSTEAQWIQESFAIVFGALLLVIGRIADIIGARRVKCCTISVRLRVQEVWIVSNGTWFSLR
ncbi:MFS transporter [Nocardia rosealba]|uniref:MFS transporter n=1 Tax=Nocardia rosealba TaxID=2878563 RepID=UPI001CD91B15|nr:MFS transporter [Nocardia rosealba]MCA2208639.1 hypothetical protein [Nocardia rosealba]